MMAPSDGIIFQGGGGGPDPMPPEPPTPLDKRMPVNLFSYKNSTITTPFQTSDIFYALFKNLLAVD